MVLRRVIAVILVAPALVIACGSDRLTGPEPGAAVVQTTVEPAPAAPARPVLPFPFTPDVEDVIPSGVYTMTIEFDQSCRIPPSLNPMTYELTAAKGFLVTRESRPPLYACGFGTIGRIDGGLAVTITGAAWVGDASTKSCGANARHRVTLTLRP